MITKTLPTDTRSRSQKLADEAAAAGDWQGFEVESLLTEEGALQIIHHCQNMAKLEGEMDQTIVAEALSKHPFRWKDQVFRIVRLQYLNGEALVEIAPHNEELIAELKRRVEGDRFHNPGFYLGFGFISFPEDYQKYQS